MYSLKDYYNQRKKSTVAQPDPGFVSAAWPVQRFGDDGLNTTSPIPMSPIGPITQPTLGSKTPPLSQLANQQTGSIINAAQPMIPQPTLAKPRYQKISPFGFNGSGSNNGQINPYETLLQMIGSPAGGQFAGQQNAIKVPPGLDPKQYMAMTPEQKAQIAALGQPPQPGWVLQQVRKPGGWDGLPTMGWQWGPPPPPMGNF